MREVWRLSRLLKIKPLIGVIGLGYAGLPLALLCAKNNFKVLGFDIDEKKVEKISKGECYISYLNSKDVENINH